MRRLGSDPRFRLGSRKHPRSIGTKWCLLARYGRIYSIRIAHVWDLTVSNPLFSWYRRMCKSLRFRAVLRKSRFCLAVVKMALPMADHPWLDDQERRSGSLPPCPPLNNIRQCHCPVALPDTIRLDTNEFHYEWRPSGRNVVPSIPARIYCLPPTLC